MRIGLTYDLRSDYLAEGFTELETAEFDRPDTIIAIESALRGLRFETDRIGHFRQLVQRVAAGDRWDLVFNIAEGLHGIGRESQVPALLDAYEIPYTFSDPLVNALTLHKALAKRVVRDAGIPTADFFVVERMEDVATAALPFPVFAKPIAEGTAKGIDGRSKIRSREELDAACARLLAAYRQPVLVETFLPGREFTVGIVGTGPAARVIGTMEIELLASADPEIYTYTNKEHCEERVRYHRASDSLARRAESVSLAAYRVLGCRDAGRVDVRADAQGEIRFLEINPLAGLHPEHSDLPIICTLHGIPFQELIRQIVESAAARSSAAGIRQLVAQA
ncbi:MAG: D-alanine--D-alanine ligase [Phycisphaerae bacterium]|nr:D-alanine--D-alanine ligase [Phycisphaerae bacterium]